MVVETHQKGIPLNGERPWKEKLLVVKCCGGVRNPPKMDTNEWRKTVERRATCREVLWRVVLET